MQVGLQACYACTHAVCRYHQVHVCMTWHENLHDQHACMWYVCMLMCWPCLACMHAVRVHVQVVAMLERDQYLGRIALGRVASGRVALGDKVRM